ncbi:perosamine synthetase [Caldanaerobacter subterraneus subsp. tengcongensis MB4]|uniref:Predicted pyridoxal phosphate-dependent enzyme apparently involved in regulation of cell wall biogenesis n=2 Tax=Caldanaerobacter subterraneus TaxID=911092 RepID=Q8RBY7_CALS4|nr:DegT/DnrJ/EryC1/StrS family aminotransferase [Caldanaerobacter subterraneus]AAM23933.1 predicted pyridoxal phosphate-dependent enzyme apparently involved in regulation of cell wall biogenesis [Caldanaerobacter subterraneus subsp. tengcongensis MB4]ERM92681.1 polysaccharide biosynthesis protein [Caldanaerobacter subterraneus subsp. yonseiensis KB-1]MCS3916559.1 perosamine synthetase [Caldanaerobacter subterraneus subsp. tengcongensis MB4]
MKVPLSRPDITQKEIDAVVEVLRSDILSIGPKIEEFERKIADYVGKKYAIAVNSGTSALHLIVRALGIKDGDEVITTPFTFIASVNCFLFERAKPVFVDIDPDTLNMDINKIEEKITEKTKAILTVDVFGQPMDMEKVNEIAKKYGLKVIEDSCEALGSEYKGIKAGTLCDAGAFAFYPNKQITTAEGGVIVTDDEEIAQLCRSMRSQGRPITGLWLEHERLGFNYRLSELHAALGIVQLERIEEIIKRRLEIAEKYNERLKDVKGVKIPYIAPEVNKMSWFVYVIRVDENIDRDKVMQYLIDNGIGCRPYFTPVHLQSYIKELTGHKEGDFPITEKVARSTIALPFFNKITDEQIDYVVDKLKEAIKIYSR